jgi:hypothetical protein
MTALCRGVDNCAAVICFALQVSAGGSTKIDSVNATGAIGAVKGSDTWGIL